MNSKWPTVPLGEVLSHRKEFIEVNDLETYKRCRVQLHAQGIVLRDQVLGAEIKTKKQQVCRAGEFLVAEIDAKLGGYGIVPNDLERSIVSSHYFLFTVNEEKLNRSFLGYFIRTPAFFEQVAAQGSTNYAAIRPTHVLEYTIPLPSLSEQRRLVNRIDALAARIEEAKTLRADSSEAIAVLPNRFLSVLVDELAQSHGSAHLGDLLTQAGYGTSTKCFLERDNGATPVLRIPNVATENVTLKNLKYGSLSTSELEKCHLVPGDILMVRTNGSLDLVGRSAVVPTLPEATAFASYMIRLRCDEQRIEPCFLQLMLRHLRTSGQLVDFASPCLTVRLAVFDASP